MTVMIICGAALLVDRLFISSEATTPAVVLAEGSSPSPQAGAVASDRSVEAQPIPELSFPRRLPRFEIETPLRDLFEPPLRTVPGAATESSSDNLDGKGAAVTRAGDRKSFVKVHRLHAALDSEGLKIAIVDGSWLRPGDSLDGCTLVALEGGNVRFECSDGDAELKMETRREIPGG